MRTYPVDAAITVEPHLVVRRLQLSADPHFVGQRTHLAVAVRQQARGAINDEAFATHSRHPPSNDLLGFEHPNLEAGLLQPVRRSQTGDTGTHYNSPHIGIHPPTRRPPAR